MTLCIADEVSEEMTKLVIDAVDVARAWGTLIEGGRRAIGEAYCMLADLF
jgi:hypothetical protein